MEATEQHGEFVTIEVDLKSVKIHRGNEPVATIKQLGGVPAAYELDQVIDGKLEPLPDDGHVVIKGGEVFKSQPHKGHSS